MTIFQSLCFLTGFMQEEEQHKFISHSSYTLVRNSLTHILCVLNSFCNKCVYLQSAVHQISLSHCSKPSSGIPSHAKINKQTKIQIRYYTIKVPKDLVIPSLPPLQPPHWPPCLSSIKHLPALGLCTYRSPAWHALPR